LTAVNDQRSVIREQRSLAIVYSLIPDHYSLISVL
jgi:hypothetical protein